MTRNKKRPVYATIYEGSQVCLHYAHTEDTNNSSLSGCGGLERFRKYLYKDTPIFDITNVPVQVWLNTPREVDKYSNVSFEEFKEFMAFFGCQISV